jgi:WD40 repeat protein
MVSLPTELAMLVCERCPLSSLGALASVSKQLRQMVYCDELWENVCKAAPWVSSCSDDWRQKAPSVRLAVRREVELERQWLAGRFASAELPLQRCRAHERSRETVCCTLTSDERILLTGLDPPTFQVWSAKSPHLMTHCVRGRPADRFLCFHLPAAPGRKGFGRALSLDRRKDRGHLYLWEVPRVPARSSWQRDRDSEENAAEKPLKLVGHSRRVDSLAFCNATCVLATSDDCGELILWALAGATPAVLGRHLTSRPVETLLMAHKSLLVCGARDGVVGLLSFPEVETGARATEEARPISPLEGSTTARETEAAASPSEAKGRAGDSDQLGQADTLPDLAVLDERALLGHTDRVTHMDAHASRGSGVLVTGSRDHTARVWSLCGGQQYGTCLHIVRGHTRWVTSVCLGFGRPSPSPASKSTPTCCGDIAPKAQGGRVSEPTFFVTASADNTLRVWGLVDGAPKGILRGHRKPITDFVLRGTRVVSSSLDTTVRVWELGALFMGDADLARGGAPGQEAFCELIRSWPPSVHTAADVSEWQEVGRSSTSNRLEQLVGPDPAAATVVASAALTDAVLCEDDPPSSVAPLCVFRGHRDFVRSVCFDHQRCISTGDDGRVCVCIFQASHHIERATAIAEVQAGAMDRHRETAEEAKQWLERPDTPRRQHGE